MKKSTMTQHDLNHVEFLLDMVDRQLGYATLRAEAAAQQEKPELSIAQGMSWVENAFATIHAAMERLAK